MDDFGTILVFLLWAALVGFVSGAATCASTPWIDDEPRRCIYRCAQERMGVVECESTYAVCGANGTRRLIEWRNGR